MSDGRSRTGRVIQAQEQVNVVMLVAFILGCDNFYYVDDIKIIFVHNNHLDKPMTQYFASIRMSNYS
jgi:hypothetical protein